MAVNKRESSKKANGADLPGWRGDVLLPARGLASLSFPPSNPYPFLLKVQPELGREGHPRGTETELYPTVLIPS